MKEDPHHPLRHLEHPSSTVIHQHQDDTILARWLRHGVEQGPKFWFSLVGVVAAAIGLGLLANYLLHTESTTSQAWMDLTVARTSEQQLKVAETYPKSVPARWARLEAASMVFNQGFDQLPAHREAAAPLFKKAYELYSKVYEETAKSDPPVARLAAFGMARTLEASDDIKRAIAQYRLVASTFPGTDEAKGAEALAKALQNKKNVEFYEWLAGYKPSEMTLPPYGRGIIGNDIPPPGVSAGSVPSTDLPTNVFESDAAGLPAPPPPPTPAPSSGTTSPSATPPATPPADPGAPDAPKETEPRTF